MVAHTQERTPGGHRSTKAARTPHNLCADARAENTGADPPRKLTCNKDRLSNHSFFHHHLRVSTVLYICMRYQNTQILFEYFN